MGAPLQPRGGLPPASLLDRVVREAMDEDYADAARRRGSEGTGRNRSLLWVAIVALGALRATAAAETQRTAPALAQERSALVAQIQARSARLEALRARTSDLRDTVQASQVSRLNVAEANRTIGERLMQLAVSTGADAASGPGVSVRVDDAPGVSGQGGRGRVLDTDLQTLVNGLWQAGAEAIAIDGHRLTSLSAIRGAGQAITVGYSSLTPPYDITALGDPDTLPAAFLETSAGQSWLDLQTNLGLRFAMTSKDALTVPGDPSLRTCCRQAAVDQR
jgi:uncharacterized protein YlxW (UPF0749 family)